MMGDFEKTCESCNGSGEVCISRDVDDIVNYNCFECNGRGKILTDDRLQHMNNKDIQIVVYGLSRSGKSTIAQIINDTLKEYGLDVTLSDDEHKYGLNSRYINGVVDSLRKNQKTISINCVNTSKAGIYNIEE